MPITGSVGDQGNNVPREVQYVQALLNVHRADTGADALALDGIVGPKTISAIRDFQTAVTGQVDGLVEPGKAAITALETLTADIVPEVRTIGSLALVLSWEPVQVEPQPVEEPSLDDSELMTLVGSILDA
ncbi:MAG: hypothetical protein JOZ81_34765 [Chloroflexi bacterium]|nr:hypothetical protein [Chloroflexota bacterium]